MALSIAHTTITKPFTYRLRVWVGVAVVLTGLNGLPAWADSDHDRARQAVQSGQVLPLPLPAVLEQLAREVPGQVLEVELERDDGRWIYEIKLLQTGGQLVKLKVDAQTAQVLRRKSRDDNH
jgi:hypothetical protein